MIEKIKNGIPTEDKIRYTTIFVVALLLCQGFLQMHYSSDTYVLLDLGYMEYPKHYFLRDGRIVSAAVCFLGGILQLPYEVYIVTLNVFALIFVATAICVMSNTLIHLLKPADYFHKGLVTILAFMLVLSPFALEYQLFPESGVMCLGLLMITKSINVWVCYDGKRKYLRIFAYLLAATLCYQGLINIFPTMVMLIFIVRQILTPKNKRFEYKKAILDIGKMAGLTLIVMAILWAVVEISMNILGAYQDRVAHVEGLLDWIYRLSEIFVYTYYFWVYNMEMLPHHLNTFFVVLVVVLLIVSKAKKRIIFQYLFFMAAVIAIIALPNLLIYASSVRLSVPVSMFWGASLTILYAHLNTHGSDKLKKLSQAIIILSYILYCICITRVVFEHIASNKVEDMMGEILRATVENYEEETGITVTKFAPVLDANPYMYSRYIKPHGSLTERRLAPTWSTYQAANFYCDRKFERAYASSITEDYDSFSADLIYFIDDAVFMIVY